MGGQHSRASVDDDRKHQYRKRVDNSIFNRYNDDNSKLDSEHVVCHDHVHDDQYGSWSDANEMG